LQSHPAALARRSDGMDLVPPRAAGHTVRRAPPRPAARLFLARVARSVTTGSGRTGSALIRIGALGPRLVCTLCRAGLGAPQRVDRAGSSCAAAGASVVMIWFSRLLCSNWPGCSGCRLVPPWPEILMLTTRAGPQESHRRATGLRRLPGVLDGTGATARREGRLARSAYAVCKGVADRSSAGPRRCWAQGPRRAGWTA